MKGIAMKKCVIIVIFLSVCYVIGKIAYKMGYQSGYDVATYE